MKNECYYGYSRGNQMSREDQAWLKRQQELLDMNMPGMVKSPKPGTPEYYKWIQDTYADDEEKE